MNIFCIHSVYLECTCNCGCTTRFAAGSAFPLGIAITYVATAFSCFSLGISRSDIIDQTVVISSITLGATFDSKNKYPNARHLASSGDIYHIYILQLLHRKLRRLDEGGWAKDILIFILISFYSKNKLFEKRTLDYTYAYQIFICVKFIYRENVWRFKCIIETFHVWEWCERLFRNEYTFGDLQQWIIHK